MSHYTVLVIGPDYEAQLAPFNEQDETYFSFVDCTGEVVRDYNEKKVMEFYCDSSSSWGKEIPESLFRKLGKMNVGQTCDTVFPNKPLESVRTNGNYKGYYTTPNGNRSKNSQWFKVIGPTPKTTELISKKTGYSKTALSLLSNEYITGEVTIQKINPPEEIPLSSKYDTIEKCVEDWFGYKTVDGKYGYYANPNAKWDWYQMGGRWQGMLKLKRKPVNVLFGEMPELGMSHDEITALIDLYKRNKTKFNEVVSKYNGKETLIRSVVDSAVNVKMDLPEHKLGNPSLVYKNTPIADADQALKGDIDWDAMNGTEDELNESYRFWELYVEGKKAISDHDKELIKNVFYKKEYYVEKYGNKETYAKLTNAFSTYAVLKNGEWFEPGQMGWFGCSSASPADEREFSEKYFDTFIKDLPDDTLITVVDCHI